ncbi:MAG: ketohexokinase [Gammaproteobacteria bacterium]|nr:ketohexokinase [Gammaproteobacteria bacterium]
MRILGVGTATLDIINSVAIYPSEDDEVRALGQRISRGGNATNTLIVLSQLGHDCTWAGTVADDTGSHLISQDLNRFDVAMDHAVPLAGGHTPTSCVTLDLKTGSRTIVHFRDLAEYSFDNFTGVDLDRFDWIHFEGRNIPELEKMLLRVRARKGSGCSLEIEKPRAGIEQLFPMTSLLMFSRHYARVRGFEDGASLLSAVGRDVEETTVMTCTWGKRGAWLREGQGQLIHNHSHRADVVLDSLGAGDVFNAGLIHGMLEKHTKIDVLDGACRLAARKVGQSGFEGLAGTSGVC